MYSDAGNGYGEGQSDRNFLTRNSSGFELTRHQEESYPFPYSGFRICLHGFNLQQVWINDTAIVCEGSSFEVNDFEQIQLHLHQHLNQVVETTATELVLT